VVRQNVLRALFGLVAIIACAAFVACGDDDDDGAADIPTATSSVATAAPTESTPATPGSSDETPGGSSNIPEVDDILDAVLSGDPAQVRPRVRFETIACTTAQGPGPAPQCREGEEEGFQVNVLEIGTCETEFRRADELEGLVEQLQAESLHAVYAGPASQGPDADYVAVFNRANDEGGVAVSIDGGIMVYVKFSCGETIDELVQLLSLGEPVYAEP
jgi:hypothetical protein